MNSSRDKIGPVLISVGVAMFLTLLPLPSWLELAWPYWVALVVIYWGLETRDLVSLGSAFVMGIILDLLTGSLLGMHALSLIILVFLVNHFRARIRFFPPWQQALSVMALLANDRIIMLWINIFRGEPFPPFDYWLAPVVGMMIWPWLFLILDRFRGVMKHRLA
jgi:rod shape-determining protein MreD